MEKHQLSPLQENLLEMMKWFDTLCRENGLTYYAVGGTLLGAVRHGGFIPWDDDIDLAMPRSDYNRLASVFPQSGRYVIETPYSNDTSFCYPITKVYDTHTTLIENKRRPLVRGTFLDIFPIDGIGSDYEAGMNHFQKIQRKYNLYLTRVGGIREGRSWYKNLAVRFSQLIPDFVINSQKLQIGLDVLCQKYPFEESSFVGNLLGAWREREILEKRLFDSRAEYQFEDITISGVADYDEYLQHIYGDWRKLPPVEKQITHHDFLELNLSKSYRE